MPRFRTKPSIPAFALYGEASAAQPDMLHIEPIQVRSKLYRWEIEAHTHQGLHQILWVAAGPAEIALDERRERCSGPVAVIIPPGVVHAFRFSRETDGFVLTFNPRAVVEGDVPATGEALRDLFAAAQILHLEPQATATGRVAALFVDLADEFAAADSAASPVPHWLGRSIVWRLAQQSARLSQGARRGSGHADLFTRFIVLVEAHHRDHWSVARYADELGMTPERLNRLTRVETGQSALDIVHARLAREACRRLTYIAAPVSKLAFELGFKDPAYFCRFFKRHTGASPRDYRRAMGVAEEPGGARR
ncbi:helix-turn-helix domain-containing protein [Bradyrhizobium sp. STM 3809]|uniref:helix-turn-helix domain-containing protein n=1 Tax=Bradyrhizobium sp. STM 3809 TaxID=551936 RepID=UPI0002409401|nr:helix-turn-helix domain-containing protein [Bradyrhizobium sp. STM 3809]CCE01835.1 putative transcriptional regulator, AraC/XylS family [Bradyrhizobium sp. STM 3809]